VTVTWLYRVHAAIPLPRAAAVMFGVAPRMFC
jgi:hypothetical protein